MSTRRSNRLRAASAAAPASANTDDVQAEPIDQMQRPAPALASTSRRARRLSQTAATDSVVMDPIAEAVEPVAQMAEPVVVLSEAAAGITDDQASAASPGEYSAAVADAAASEIDVFAVASEAFGFAAVDDEICAPEADEIVEVAAAPVQLHTAPRRARVLRRAVAAGASFGIMGVAGLIAVSMTLPASAVAASQGSPAPVTASLTTARGGASAPTTPEGEIQAFVASAGVQDEGLQRSESFSTISLAEVAEEEGIRYSNSLYTNDPDAAIQWPFKVGVAMSSPYGERWGRLHAGIDLVPGNGATIQAIADGVVREATESGGAYGVTVYIDHVIDGKVVTSHYAHMQHGSLQVKTGQKVKVGDPVGKVGNTGRSYGAHLHFEIMVGGTTIDPLPWMRENAGRYEY